MAKSYLYFFHCLVHGMQYLSSVVHSLCGNKRVNRILCVGHLMYEMNNSPSHKPSMKSVASLHKNITNYQ